MNLKARLVSKIEKEYPELKFKKAELVTKGFDHDVLVLDNKFIVRFAKAKLYKLNFIREVNFLKKFGKISNIKVPNYTFISKDKTYGGYNIIEGRELESKIYEKLSAKKKQKIIRELAKFLSILHNFPINRARALGFKNYGFGKKEQAKRKRWFKREYYPKMSKHLTQNQLNFIRKFMAEFTLVRPNIKPVLGHYDLSHDHIIMKPDSTISGIIDFGDMSISDPAFEFNGFFDYDQNMTKEIYKYYQGPKDPGFLRRTNDHYIHRWIFLLYDSKIRRKNPFLWKQSNKIINRIIKENENSVLWSNSRK